MFTDPLNSLLNQVRRAGLAQEQGGLTDAQLLECFTRACDEAAFEALMRRHGSMVMGVCRRVLGQPQDAEDAFQATFLVLARKAASIRQAELLGNWLYGVAYRAALEVKAAKRRVKERQVESMPEPVAAETRSSLSDFESILDRELQRLPEKYRAAVVLCDLEGVSRREAAQRLGLPDGTLSGRLTTAHRKLAQRLSRCGVTLSLGALAALLSQSRGSACVPAPLMTITAKAAARCAAGELAADLVSPTVAALTEGVSKAMLMNKFKVTVAALAVVGMLTLGSGWLLHQALGRVETATPSSAAPLTAAALEPALEKMKEGVTLRCALARVDADKGSVTIRLVDRALGPTEKSYLVAKDARILFDGKPVKLADLKSGAAKLTLGADQQTVLRISVEGPLVVQKPVRLESVDADQRTLTIVVLGKPHSFAVAKDVKVMIDGKEAKLADLNEGLPILLKYDADGKTVVEIRNYQNP